MECSCEKFKFRKYGGRRSEHNGQFFGSKKERDYAAELDLRIKAGDIVSYDKQVKIPLMIRDANGREHTWRNYIIDFVLTYPDESKEYVEVKGFPTETWKMKWDVFEILYGALPNVRLTIVR